MTGWNFFKKLNSRQKVKFLINFESCPFNDNTSDIMSIFNKEYNSFYECSHDAFVVAGEETWDYWNEIKIEA